LASRRAPVRRCPGSMAAHKSLWANDCYVRLGVPRHATVADIKRAFHEQARLWHPDKCCARDATERFRLVREAYETLASPRRRAAHNRLLPSHTTVGRRSCPAGLRSRRVVVTVSASSAVSQSSSAAVANRIARTAGAGFPTTAPMSRRLGRSTTACSPLPQACADAVHATPTSAKAPLGVQPAAPPEVTKPCKAIAELLAVLADNGRGLRLHALRRLGEQCGIAWPRGCPDRQRLLEELAVAARETLDDRIRNSAWQHVHVRDLVMWLQAKGCEFSFSLDGDTATCKEHMISLAKEVLAKAVRGNDAASPSRRTPSTVTVASSLGGPDILRDDQTHAGGNGDVGYLPSPTTNLLGKHKQGARKVGTFRPKRRRSEPVLQGFPDGIDRDSPPCGPQLVSHTEGLTTVGADVAEVDVCDPASAVAGHAEPDGVAAEFVSPGVVLSRLANLREQLEAHRSKGNGADQSILTALAKLESLDTRGAIDRHVLAFTKLGVELNGVWWKSVCRGPAAVIAARLVAKWKERCSTASCKQVPFACTPSPTTAASSEPEPPPKAQSAQRLGTMTKSGRSPRAGCKRSPHGRYEAWKDGYFKLRAYGLTTLRVSPRLAKR